MDVDGGLQTTKSGLDRLALTRRPSATGHDMDGSSLCGTGMWHEWDLEITNSKRLRFQRHNQPLLAMVLPVAARRAQRDGVNGTSKRLSQLYNASLSLG